MSSAEKKQLLEHSRRFHRMHSKLEITRKKAGELYATIREIEPLIKEMERVAQERPGLWPPSKSCFKDLRKRAEKLPYIHREAAKAIRQMEALLKGLGGTPDAKLAEQEINLARAQRFDSDQIRRDIERLLNWAEKAEHRCLALFNLKPAAVQAQRVCSSAAAVQQEPKKRIRKS